MPRISYDIDEDTFQKLHDHIPHGMRRSVHRMAAKKLVEFIECEDNKTLSLFILTTGKFKITRDLKQ